MKTAASNFTVAEYCNQLSTKQITINPDYQRTDRVWPASARSFLIDTILNDYPLPKISLAQKTDLANKMTSKEVVDGQQRTAAIYDFYLNKYRLSIGKYSGNTFASLEDNIKTKFLEYILSADVLVGAAEDDIREVFRRYNSYNIPLNAQELRHAQFQGKFKWMIVRLSRKYAAAFKSIGVFSERQLSRMAESAILSEMAQILLVGIESASESKLNALYKKYENEFTNEDGTEARVDSALGYIIETRSVHKTSLATRYNVYSLFSAIAHAQTRVTNLENLFSFSGKLPLADQNQVRVNLGILAEALESPNKYPGLAKFIEACSKGTNRLAQREARFQWFCKALLPTAIEF